jgi:hypothetical protein
MSLATLYLLQIYCLSYLNGKDILRSVRMFNKVYIVTYTQFCHVFNQFLS